MNFRFYSFKGFKDIVLLIIFLFVYLAVCVFLVFISLKDSTKDYDYEYASKLDNAPVIVIDAGHGGFDGGAVSESGIAEKDINLEISKYIFEYCRLSGVNCIMTRADDSMLSSENAPSASRKMSDLIARCEIAQKNPDYVFVSIHQNKFPSSKYKGLQVFYSRNHEGSRVLAGILKDNNRQMIDQSNKREAKMSGREIYILDSLKGPAVLVECGFLSNSAEAEKLATEEYRKQLAFMIYTSLMQYIFSENT